MESKRERRRHNNSSQQRLTSQTTELSTMSLLGKSLEEMSNIETGVSEFGLSNKGYEPDSDSTSNIINKLTSHVRENCEFEELNENGASWGLESVKNSHVLSKNTHSNVDRRIVTAEKPLESDRKSTKSARIFSEDAASINRSSVTTAKRHAKNLKISSTSQSDETVLNVWTAPESHLKLLRAIDEDEEQKQEETEKISKCKFRIHKQKQQEDTKNAIELPKPKPRKSKEKAVKAETELTQIRALPTPLSSIESQTSEKKSTAKKLKLENIEKSNLNKCKIKENEIENAEKKSTQTKKKKKTSKNTTDDVTLPETQKIESKNISLTTQPTVETKVKRKKKEKEIQKEKELDKSEEGEVKKAKKKKIKTSEITTTDSQVSCSDESIPGEVLGVLIHGVDGLKMHFLISHPVVQVHLFDLNTGNYVEKSSELKSVISYYESENSSVNHILPVMTQPYEMKGKQVLTPEWQEILIFNESIEYFFRENSNVVVFFEILDFVSSMNQVDSQCRFFCLDDGWYRIAWAFLKLLGSGNVRNIEKKVQLQLYYPPKKKLNFLCKRNISTCGRNKPLQLLDWWANTKKKKYPYTLFVTVKGIRVPEVEPGLRSMIPTQKERGKTTLDDLQKTLGYRESVETTELISEESLVKQPEIRWNRIPGQSCKIPNKKTNSIQVGSQGCFTVKFSHNGRFLACGSSDKQTNSVLLYEIPSAKLKYTYSSHFGIIYQLSWSLNDTRLLSSSADCTARLWFVEPFQEKTNKILPHPSYVYSSVFHPQVQTIIVTGCYDHIVRIWDVGKEDCELLQELSQHLNMVNAVCFDIKGDSLFTGDGSGVICKWNVYVTTQPNKPACTRDWTLNNEIKCNMLKNKVINDIIFHPNGRKMFVSTRDSCIRLIDIRQFTLTESYQGHINLFDYIHISISPCGSFLISGSEDGKVYVWIINTGKKMHTYSDLNFKRTVNSVDYHPHDNILACCAFADNAPVQIVKYESDTQEVSTLDLTTASEISNTALLKQQTTISAPVLDTSSGDESVTDLNPTTSKKSCAYKLPKSNLTKSSLTKSNVSYSLSVLKGSTTSLDKNRSVTFQDEFPSSTSITHSKWKVVLDKLESIVDTSSVSTYETTSVSVSISSSTNLPEQSSTSTSILTSIPTLMESTENSSTKTSSTTSTQSEFKVVSLYTFNSSTEGELDLKPGDVIQVTRRINEHWWEGKSTDGRRGAFPSNYVYRVESNYTSSVSTPTPVPLPKRRRKKTLAIPSLNGPPIFLSASEDELKS